MTVRSGKGWITLQRGKVATTGETALECKARLLVKKQQESKRHDRTQSAR
ncbi:MAG: hypothetical protein ACOYNY_41590 [Caldilineaceae bacterium]|jgi:hypothetical protein